MTSSGYVLLAVVIAIGIAARTVDLGRIPGMNGDEAWYGVNVDEFLAGRPYFDRTLVGNRLNPFHSGPLLIASLVAPPSFALLRAPAVLWGVLSVLLAYPLLRQPLGSRVALMVTALLSVSTAAVGQARLGWDPGGTIFFSLLAMASALRGRPIAAGAAGLAALAVHPTSIFLAPMAASAWAPYGWSWLNHASQRTRRMVAAAAVAIALIGPVAGFFVARTLAHRGLLPSIEMAVDRLFSPSQWIGTATGLVQLEAGVTTARAIAGSGMSPAALSATVLLAVTLVLAVVLRIPHNAERRRWAWWLAAGIVISAVAFHVVGGQRGLHPGLERYALSFVVPLAILASLGLDAAWQRHRVSGASLATAVWLAMTLVLLGGYFMPLESGQAGHESYRTGPVEPKEAAFEFIRQDSGGAGLVTIFAENWWLYWPIRYLAVPEATRIVVEQLEPETLRLHPPGASLGRYRHRPDRVYAVVFSTSAETQRLASLGHVVFTAADAGNRSILLVYLIPPDHADRVVDRAPWVDSGSGR